MKVLGVANLDCYVVTSAAPVGLDLETASQTMQAWRDVAARTRHDGLIRHALFQQTSRRGTQWRMPPSRMPLAEAHVGTSGETGRGSVRRGDVASDTVVPWRMSESTSGAGESRMPMLLLFNQIVATEVHGKYRERIASQTRPGLDELKNHFRQAFGHDATVEEVKSLIAEYLDSGFIVGAVLSALYLMLWHFEGCPMPSLPALAVPKDRPQHKLMDRIGKPWLISRTQVRKLAASLDQNLTAFNPTFNYLPERDGSGLSELAYVGIDLHSLYQTLNARLILTRQESDYTLTDHEEDLFRMLQDDPSGFERAILRLVLLNERQITETPYGEVMLLRFLMMFYETAVARNMANAERVLGLTEWLSARAENFVRTVLQKISTSDERAQTWAMRGFYNNVVDPLLVVADYNLWMNRPQQIAKLKSEVVTPLGEFFAAKGLSLAQDTRTPNADTTPEQRREIVFLGFTSLSAKYWRTQIRTHSYAELADQIPSWITQAEQDFPDEINAAPLNGYVNGRRVDWIHFLRDVSEMPGIPPSLAKRARKAASKHLKAEMNVFGQFGQDVLGYTHWLTDQLLEAIVGPGN